MSPGGIRIGFVSTRFSGSDGVSLETRKWASVLEGMGHTCFYFAGESDRPAERTTVVPEAMFTHPEIQSITAAAFRGGRRAPEVSVGIARLAAMFKDRIAEFVAVFGLDLLIAENALTIPLNIPLGLALTEFIAENDVPVIAHHHDFHWERDRFLVNCVGDYLSMAFPPALPGVHHVVINSLASQQLSLRKGVSVRMIPNVMDFDHPPEPPERTTAEVRALLGFAEDADEHLVLQPTRVVQRKGIEHAIELVKRIGLKARLVVSHDQIDEGHGYVRRILEYAELLGVRLEFLADKVRQRGNGGVVSLGDLYRAADLVTYPSTIEGFGNALVEAIYYRRPVVVNRYSIYSLDIAPKGFRMIEFDDYVTDDVVAEARRLVENPALAEEMTEHNYQLGRRYYSFRTLEAQLQALVRDCLGESAA